MAETLKLDPSGVAESRTEWDITKYVGGNGPDFGDAQIEAYMAEQSRGGYPVDYRVPNRTVQIPLLIRNNAGNSGLTFEQARAKMQAKVALFQREGGWFSRQTSIGTVYADVVNASLKMGGSTLQAAGLVDADAVLTLECLPDWYGDEITLSTHDETTLPELIFTETGIKGDWPARVRLVLTDTATQDRMSVIWGFRSRHYGGVATSNRLGHEAESLTFDGGTSVVALAGASGGNVVRRTTVGTSWVPLITDQSFTHVGAYRVWARVHTTSSASPKLRLKWRLQVSGTVTTNAPWAFPGASNFYLADLGEVRLDQAPVGSHNWYATIEATATSASQTVSIDRVYLQPLDESAGQINGTSASGGPLLATNTLEIRTDGVYRGVGGGTPGFALGDLPRLPPAGIEARTCEVFVLPSRGQIGTSADGGIDDIRGQLIYRPCWLTVPAA